MIGPGTLIDGRYQVTRLLGRGAFASVYLARHTGLMSEHAIKVLDPHLALDPGIRERFLAEGRIQARLVHPYIVHVTEIVTQPLPGLVLEFVAGKSLDAHLRDRGGKLEVAEAAKLMGPLLDAIGFAHAQNVIHRDLKPENVLVGFDRAGTVQPKVTDFGVARVLGQHGMRQTQHGARIGTLLYMSPEQVRGAADVDQRSDVFALGAILQELVSGTPAFDDADELRVMQRIVEGRAHPLPPAASVLANCLARALAVEPARRYPDCGAFRAALERALAGDARAAATVAVPSVQEGESAVGEAQPGGECHVSVELHGPGCVGALLEHGRQPLLRDVVIRHLDGPALRRAFFTVQLGPGLGAPVPVPLPPLRPGEDLSLATVDVRAAPGVLTRTTSSGEAILEWSIHVEDRVVSQGTRRLRLLAHDEWPGTTAPVALLGAFVRPDDPVVARLVARIQQEHPPARSSARVHGQVVALTQQLQALGLQVLPPGASLEPGARIRRFEELLLAGSASELELSVLVASCLERMGFSPVLAVTRTRALAAVWISDDRFPEGTVEDVDRVLTAAARDELLWIDPAAMAGAPLDTAAHAAVTPQAFLFALDVAQIRREIPPFAWQAVHAPPAAPDEPSTQARHRLLAEAAQEPEPRPAIEAVSNDVARRFDKWQERLLDLTLRNKLLNFRPESRGALPLAVPDVGAFEDLLAEHRQFEIVHGGGRDPGADLAKCILHTELGAEELWARVRRMAQEDRTALDEGGATTLYVAIGLLKWRDPADEERLAPLLLYPVTFELDRVRQRVRFKRLPEDPLPNFTLVEKMARDYQLDLSAVIQLEPDDHGVSVAKLLDAVRTATAAMPDWEVREEAHLGLFTFTKFLMWRDLRENREHFLKNAVVGHIAAGKGAFAGQPAEVAPEQVDQAPSSALPLVVDADSTQVAAVASALAGRSFVLQGPPGTGKSQTITNLIAAAMARGKTVLFVSEKLAALEVVHRRLQEAGLADFCLELHSHKTNKKAVLASLQQAWDRSRRAQSSAWEDQARRRDELRDRLNAYVQALHRERPLGLSFRGATARLLHLGNTPKLRLAIPDLAATTSQQFARMQEAVAELSTLAAPLGPVASHPLRDIRCRSWSQLEQETLADAIDDTRRKLGAIEVAAQTLASELRQPVPGPTAALDPLGQLGLAIGRGPVPETSFDERWPQIEGGAALLVRSLREDRDRRAALARRWRGELFALPLRPLAERFARWASAFFLFAWFALWSARRTLKAVATSAKLGKNADIAKELAVAAEVQKAEPALAQLCAAVERALPGIWSGQSRDPDMLDAALARSRLAATAWRALGGGAGQVPVHAAAIERTPEERARISEAASALLKARDALREAEAALHERARAREADRIPWSAPDHRARLRERLDAWSQHLPSLRAWSLYRAAEGRARALALDAVVDAHAHGTLTASELPEEFERSFLARWTALLRDGEPALREFDGSNHQRVIDRFAELDQAQQRLAREEVIARLEQRLPRPDGHAVENSETGILLRELKKKTRHLAVRRLLQALPTLRARLKPCLLMSPLSIAQYLPADGAPFDLVVFDEASQIGTHDALGAIARGRQVVIVGDSRQLPPTAFFRRSLEDDDAPQDENDITELESVLDEALARQLPQQMLGWHYRSRHEALIEFSNRHFYEGRLHVFPSPSRAVEGLGIRWHPVPEGVYVRGDRVNPEEAQAVVEHLVAALRATDPGARTFGVVTFGISQQQLISDLLDQERAKDASLEAHFTGQEPVFVKNLETVQGDERDEIYFSIGYAQDDEGRLRMHFGPLSAHGGERRLNVAITRARRQLRVFSTLTYDQIDVSRTGARGAHLLRAFLEFASRSGSAGLVRTAAPQPRSAHEREIYEALRAMGYQVHADVGCGGYRIALAVVHPTSPGVYALGVECDGEHYASAHTARDRDRLRRQVLEGLGWRLHRVWSIDSMNDPPRQVAALQRAVEAAIREPARATPPEVRRPPVPLPEPEPAGDAARQEREEQLPSGDSAARYVAAELDPASGGPESLYEPAAKLEIQARLEAVIAAEAPVHQDVLFRRVAECWSVGRVSQRLREELSRHLTALVRRKVAKRSGEFVWRADQDLDAYAGFRGPAADDSPRDPATVAPQELANAMATVLAHNLSLPEQALLRDTARLFGVRRMGNRIEEVLGAALAELERRGLCAREEGTARWLG